jgi:UDP-N-acetylglucosamine 4,6-dehydratase
MSILVTGGTGSFGQACVRRLMSHTECPRICVYSRNEHTQAALRQSIPDPTERLRWFIGDVRDQDRLRRAMKGCAYVVHAAALKRIEVGAYNPMEMVKTNVIGAMNVIEAAHDAAAIKVVALSTDKAWQPISAYGQSKALAESLFLQADYARGMSGPRFSCVRYGNVWASAGSVVPKWMKAIFAGESEITVTDPDCTRFFMTMDQAVKLVWDTIGSREGGELVIPRDLPAYRVGDLVEAMRLWAGRRIQMRVTGLPPHEKKHEGMLDGLTSDKAPRLTVEQLRGEIERVGAL